MPVSETAAGPIFVNRPGSTVILSMPLLRESGLSVDELSGRNRGSASFTNSLSSQGTRHPEGHFERSHYVQITSPGQLRGSRTVSRLVLRRPGADGRTEGRQGGAERRQQGVPGSARQSKARLSDPAHRGRHDASGAAVECIQITVWLTTYFLLL